MQVLLIILLSILLGFLLMLLPTWFIMRSFFHVERDSKHRITLDGWIMLLIGASVIGGTLYLFYNII